MVCLNVSTTIASVCLDVSVKRCDKLSNVIIDQFVTPFKIDIKPKGAINTSVINKTDHLNVKYSIVCSVHQSGTIFIVNPTIVDIPYDGSAVYVKVTSNKNWEVV